VSGGKIAKIPDKNSDVIAFLAVVNKDRLTLAWQGNPEAQKLRESLAEPAYFDAIRSAQSEEFVTRRYQSAVARYQQAIRITRHPSAKAYTQLLLARTLQKANRGPESLSHYEQVHALPLDLVDEYGVPLALYAAPPLIEAGTRRGEMLEWIGRVLEQEALLPLEALYLTRDIAVNLKNPTHEDRIAQAIDEHEGAARLQSDSARKQRGQLNEQAWILFGSAPWLLSVTPPVGDGERLLVAIRVRTLLTALPTVQGIRLVEIGEEGNALGEGFPELRVVLPPETPSPGVRKPFLAVTVILALGFALLAGSLVQRDAQRSLRLAEVRSQFVSSVTHELKTPLTSIRMFSETLRLDEEVDRETRGEYLDTILHESERLSRLVDNVLDFGNIERGKRIYRFRPVRLDEVVDAAARAIQYPLEQAGFTLDIAVARDSRSIAADSDAIQQAVLNLLTNAM
jgi:signal transduction histidine kinase